MRKRSSTWLVSALVLSGVGALAACSSSGDQSGGAQATTATSPLPNAAQARAGYVRPSWATSQNFAGRVDPAERISVQVHLRMHDEAAAEAELAAISDPENARYGQFLSDAEYDAKYAPTEADVAAVRAHLEAQGLTVTHVPDNRTYVAAEGTAEQMERAFATQLGSYHVEGAVRRAPMTAPKLPSAIDARVLGVMGLSTPASMKPRAKRPGGVRTGGIKRNSILPKDSVPPNTCSEWFGKVADTQDPAYPGYPQLSYVPCGYRPAQLRRAYGFDDVVRKGNDGHGIKVAIVDAYLSPTLFDDAQAYAAQNDADYPLTASQFSAQMGPGAATTPDPGWYDEASLDVESVHAMAPGANIVYVGAQSPTDQDLVGAINLIISKKLATIVSNSYGSPEAVPNDFVIWHSIANQAGLKGVGLYFSSGDNGDESFNLGYASADFPASLDNAVAVGGTSLALDKNGAELFQVGWETGASFLFPTTTDDGGVGAPQWSPAPPGEFVFGAGGGTSYVYEQPSYQQHVVPDALANIPGAPARVVPDVAMLADPMTGFLVGDSTSGSYQEFAIGGTSLACPLFAGTMALAEQHAKRHFGFANPLLYKAYKKTPKAFEDIVPAASPQAVAIPGGVVTTFDYPSLAIRTAAGYDNVTGLGTPNGKTFLNAVK